MQNHRNHDGLRGLRWRFAGVALALGCNAKDPTVGQSGSEGVPSAGGSTESCPCGALNGRMALRVTVMGVQDDVVTLRLEEVLKGALPLPRGELLRATRYDETLACHLGCENLVVGEQAFAFYRVIAPLLPECRARSECVEACEERDRAKYEEGFLSCQCREGGSALAFERHTCGGRALRDGDDQETDCRRGCEEQTADECPPRPAQDHRFGNVSLSRWADPIVFARSAKGEISVSLTQLGELLASEDTPACMERFGQWSDLLDHAP